MWIKKYDYSHIKMRKNDIKKVDMWINFQKISDLSTCYKQNVYKST